MTSDGDVSDDENPILARHRKEKKDLRAKMLAMKKAAKSGNKQKQKETNVECEKLEKELDERHKKELADAEPSQEGPAPPAEAAAPKTDDDKKGGESAQEEDDEQGCSSKSFYKSLKISGKNAKKQAKKKEMDEKMKAAQAADKEAANSKDSEKHVEKAAVKKILAESKLKMVDIPADGDCMYSSLVHQLQEDGIETSIRKLRKNTAAYMREHKDDFLPFIADTDVGEVGADEVAHWEKYLSGVERCAEVGGTWGGELELNAIANIYQKCIVVYKTDGERRLGEQYDSKKERPLQIVFLRRAYHLGEHYNSTSSL